MEIYEAVKDFNGGQPGDNVLCLRRGDRLEVLEGAEERKYRQWWGVRRLRDHVIGFAPAKCLQFDESIPLHLLPDSYQDQRELNLRQLSAMQQEADNRMPVNKRATSVRADYIRNMSPHGSPRGSPRGSPLIQKRPVSLLAPPTQPKPFLKKTPSYDPTEDPEPDYSDGENNDPDRGSDRIGSHKVPFAQNGSSGKKSSSELTQEEWDKIVSSADADFPDPPDLDIPEPDYIDDAENKPSSSNFPPIIRPHPSMGLQDSADNGLAISAHKLRNPCLESRERLAMHKELLHNAKLGVNVLQKKSELRKALEKRQEERRRKEHEEYLKSKKTVFQKRLEEQANKIKMHEENAKKDTTKKEEEKDLPEFLRVHHKINKSKPS